MAVYAKHTTMVIYTMTQSELTDLTPIASSQTPIDYKNTPCTPEASCHCLQKTHVQWHFSHITCMNEMYTTIVTWTLMQSTLTAVTLSAYS